MAVTTPAELRIVLGIAAIAAPANEDANDATERNAVNARNLALATRLHAVATAVVERYAPGAPEELRDEGLLRVAGYLFADEPAAKVLRRLGLSGGDLDIEIRSPGSALRLSGAAALLSPYRVRRAIAVAEATT